MIEKQVCMCSSCNAHRALQAAKLADANLDRFERVTDITNITGIAGSYNTQEFNQQSKVQFPEWGVRITSEPTYRTLSAAFLKAMDDIGIYGEEKYGDQSIVAKFKRGDLSRSDRTKAREIGNHVNNHFQEYLDGVLHDKFKTRKHQLAAAAFNAMMEFQLAGLEKEPNAAL
jgi:hypothetical protein